ncbi:MAG: DUF116 domain-containing protein [Elusimicrobiota bacterium]
MKKVRNNMLAVSAFLLITGMCGLLLLESIPASVTGIILLVLGLLGISIVTGSYRYFPLPGALKRTLLFSLMLRISLLSGRIFGIDPETVMQYFIDYNNRMEKGRTGSVLLLLPNCIQNSECNKDLLSDISNCAACGRCQVGEILELIGSKDIKVILVGGGRLAMQKVKETAAGIVIAVACETELVDGIRAVVNSPVWAVNNLRPEGPCRNTKVNIEELKSYIGKCPVCR